MLNPDMPTRDRHTGQGKYYNQPTINSGSNSFGVVQRRYEKYKADSNEGDALNHAQRTRFLAQNVLQI
jgi:hypothetical protein